MLLNRKSVELLAPAGNWEALEAAVEAGAAAVYLGGTHSNMRMHRNKDTNFDDEMLKKAVEYTHAHGVHLYITLNNLISVDEVEPLKKYLAYLNEIRPDAILVQDFAVMELVKEMGIDIPLHTSVMMNTHNEHAIKKLKEYGITDRHIIGVLTAVVRDGKEIPITDWRYRLYVHLWCDLFPLRAFILKAKYFPKWLKRKLKR